MGIFCEGPAVAKEIMGRSPTTVDNTVVDNIINYYEIDDLVKDPEFAFQKTRKDLHVESCKLET